MIREAEAAKPATLDGREDWRGLALVTIDPPDAKDHGRRPSMRFADDDPQNVGGFVGTSPSPMSPPMCAMTPILIARR